MSKDGFDLSAFFRWQANFRRRMRLRPLQIASALSSAAELPVRRAQTYYLSGGALNIRTGRLRGSVTKMPASGAFIDGRKYYVVVGTNVFYGGLWERGYVNKIGRQVPARPWLRPSFDDTRGAVEVVLRRAGLI